MMNKIILAVTGVSVLSAILVASTIAGSSYNLICENKDCGWTGEVLFGGGKAFDRITGYCLESGKFIYLQWRRGENKPEPFCRIWNPATGGIVELYKSPECDGCFMPINGIQELKYCPHCGQATLKYTRKALID